MKKWICYHAPVVIWAVLILSVSSLPKLKAPSLGFPFSDKIFHGSEYMILAVLALRSFVILRGWNRKTLLLVLALCSAFGILDEVHQSFVPGRDCNVGDMAADAAGSVIGIWLCSGIRFLRKKAVLDDG
ncbi:VanZ family protein [bacterium]|nr:VanZ family protein [bacterium]